MWLKRRKRNVAQLYQPHLQQIYFITTFEVRWLFMNNKGEHCPQRAELERLSAHLLSILGTL